MAYPELIDETSNQWREKNQNDLGSKFKQLLQIIYLKHQRQEAGDKTQ